MLKFHFFLLTGMNQFGQPSMPMQSMIQRQQAPVSQQTGQPAPMNQVSYLEEALET